MNYRHIYHAGNFADLVKHLILVVILKKLQEKDKGFTVLDAFAGIGIYDLKSIESQKTQEYKNGIGMITDDTIPNNPVLSDYLSIIKSLNSLDLYAGSPQIISSLLREQDDLIAAELHPQDYATLKYNMRQCNRTSVHHIDGYNAIKAFLPPKNNRGLVLLDGAFEVKDEYNKIIEALKLIKKRFSAGIVMIWHPIKNEQLTQKFYHDLSQTGYSEFLKIEFELHDKPDLGMKIVQPASLQSCTTDEAISLEKREITTAINGLVMTGAKRLLGMNKCGVIIANPPYIDDITAELMQFLSNDVYKKKASASVTRI